ncbi:GlxA family transcriptional regulator [Rhodoligotrophos defluvii]|uniref:GlxA family transcriptional regulator n=1 Tax=Rhodoligotrophos defluvii TaxID=2561934 RepID=UPI0010C9A2B0|nr:GlxA family transcriptional regulator [Rhodoligotrophos defluvii]
MDKRVSAASPNAAPGRREPQLRVGFVLLERFTLNAFSGFIDALRLAADRGGRSRQIHCGWEIMGAADVTASCGLRVHLTGQLRDPAEFHYIAICGGNSYLEANHPAWLDAYLHRAAEQQVPLIGICTGTFNIARSGLLSGYPACVHWNVIEAFQEQFPDIEACSDRIFLDAGMRITCAGSAGAADLALHLIARHCGPELAQQAVRHMILSSSRPAGSPQPHMYHDLGHVRDHRVRHAIALMEQSLNQPLTIADIADEVGLSLRQLDRCFLNSIGMAPGAYFIELRLRYGASLLKNTGQSVTAISLAAGFADCAHFSRMFRLRYGVTPTAFRGSVGEAAQGLRGIAAAPHG